MLEFNKISFKSMIKAFKVTVTNVVCRTINEREINLLYPSADELWFSTTVMIPEQVVHVVHVTCDLPFYSDCTKRLW